MLATTAPTRLLAVTVSAAIFFGSVSGYAAETITQFRARIEQGYNARDNAAIEVVIADLIQAGKSGGQEDLASYYAAYARLRQSVVAGDDKTSARNYLEQCIDELESLLERRSDNARARALYASCLGSSANYYVLRSATRGIAAGREIAAALELAPDDPWVVLQDGVSDFMTPAIFGGNKERALAKLKRAEQLLVASRPSDVAGPVFGEAEAWLYIGRVYRSTDRKDLAREAWEKALSLAPDSTDVREELANL
jgi:tetratricopeptide (TPR) repeat protein